MCGLAGIVRFDGAPPPSDLLSRMAQAMHHRGPDDKGLEISPALAGCARVGLSFKRLSIQDLSPAGHQPMRSDDGQVLLAFNGEIYNAPELRKPLEAAGVTFRGHSDTEVILRLYEAKGVAAFEALNGMFAIALWDGRTRQFHLVRDRIGIKPLYYTHIAGELVFASEIKAILEHPGVKRGFDAQGVQDYLTFQFCLGEETLFEGIKLLAPGTRMTVNLMDGAVTKTRFWRWQYKPENRGLEDFAEELRETLKEVLARQIQSDVPVGTFLSSGMDTGAIAALAARHLPGMHSFTCGFDTSGMAGEETLYDERGDAQALADLLGTKHHTLTLSQSALRELFPRTLYHMESPQVGISYQIYAMAQDIKPHCTVVLSGTGGDELFAGYHWRYQGLLEEKDPAKVDAEMFARWCRLLPQERLSRLATLRAGQSARERFGMVMKECESDEALARLLHFELHGFLHGLLQLDDKLNMAHSVEARVPLLDNAVLDLAARIPGRFKYDGTTTKIVLKKALEGILPDEVIHRRKQGFTPPDAHSMRHVNRAWMEEMLTGEALKEAGLVNMKEVEALMGEHMSGAANHRFLLWALLCLRGVQEFYMQEQRPQLTAVS